MQTCGAHTTYHPHPEICTPQFLCANIQKRHKHSIYKGKTTLDAFQVSLPKAEVEFECLIKTLQVDGSGKLISFKLKLFYKKRDITIRFTTPYMYQENGIAMWEWCTIVRIKDLILIDSSFLNRFGAETMKTANYFRNRLPTKTKSHNKIIPKEAWTEERQNL